MRVIANLNDVLCIALGIGWNAYVYMPLRITHFAQQWFVWNAHRIGIRKTGQTGQHPLDSEE